MTKHVSDHVTIKRDTLYSSFISLFPHGGFTGNEEENNYHWNQDISYSNTSQTNMCSAQMEEHSSAYCQFGITISRQRTIQISQRFDASLAKSVTSLAMLMLIKDRWLFQLEGGKAIINQGVNYITSEDKNPGCL